MKPSSLFAAAFASIWLAGAVASAQTAVPTVMSPAQVAVSQPMRDGHDDSDSADHKTHNHQPLPSHGEGADQDDVRQTSTGAPVGAKLGINFPGVGASGSAPPDTNMAVGPNHILQTVNSRYEIFNKSGAPIAGPFTLSSLWSPLGNSNGCATNNGGDVVAQYDKLADRFIVTQLGGVSAPFSECIAVSQTADPTGAYFLYSFAYGSTLNDYPKFGVWPTTTNSAFLATFNLFANGQTFTGGQLCAYDRTKMLAGNPTAQAICFTINGDGGFLPADLDGSTPPLDGTPGYFLNFETLSSLRKYALAPNFANPAASTLTAQTPDIAVASFGQACSPSFTCVPQSGTTQRLDSLGDRLMYRLAFRNFGDHEALVVNHSVTAGTSVGVRWYELRAPVSTSGAFSLFQQGTFAPDSTFRWMGSAAMDRSGDIGVGYSASSSTIHPAIRFAGRVPTDPAGTLEAEASMIEGTGSQTGGLSRWGDYSAMRIDPADDCTFWYTNEYLQANGSFNWSSFFGSFKFNTCGAPPTPDFSMSSSPTSLTLTQGGSGTSAITVTALNGFTGSVGLTVTGCPTGATCSLNPTSVTPGTNSILTVATTASTTTGTFTLTVTGTSGSLTHSTTVALTVNAAAAPNFSMSSNPTSLTLTQGGSGTSAITVTALNGFTGSVSLSITGCPTGATCSLNPTSVTPGTNSTLTVSTTANATTGTFTLTVTGTSGTLVHSTTVGLTVNPAAGDFTIAASPSVLNVNRSSSGQYTVTIAAVNGSAPVNLSVSGLPSHTSARFSPNPASSPGTSTLTITVSRRGVSGTNATLTITGNNGSHSHSTTVTLHIN
jgi:hypothetical protein